MASQPWETNYERIPSLVDVEWNAFTWATKLVQKFCPDSFSPTLVGLMEKQQGYFLVHEDGYPSDSCGPWKAIGLVQDQETCAEESRKNGQSAFAYGKGV